MTPSVSRTNSFVVWTTSGGRYSKPPGCHFIAQSANQCLHLIVCADGRCQLSRHWMLS
jgi:hypothetical protein